MPLSDETRRTLEAKPNVQGVGTDPETGDVIVFVTEKIDASLLADDDLVPERVVDLDGNERETSVLGVGTVWRQSGGAVESHTRKTNQDHERTHRYDPVPAGVSCGHRAITAGTWGTPNLDLGDYRRPVIGTNAHVGAPPGDSEPNDSILQPGPHDGGVYPQDDAGRLVSSSDISKDEDNMTDLAFFEAERDVTDTILGFDDPLIRLGEPRAGDDMAKSGRTTDVTQSVLLARDVSINVRGYFPNETARFVGIDAYAPMSQGGDSGSLIVAKRSDSLVGTGFLFAGGPQATFAIPMRNVHAEFGEVGVHGPPPDEDDDHEGDGAGDVGGGLLGALWSWLTGLF